MIRGPLIGKASMVFTTIRIKYNFKREIDAQIVHKIHAAMNSPICTLPADLLIRHASASYDNGQRGTRKVILINRIDCKHVQQLLKASDSSTSFSVEIDFIDFWGHVRSALDGMPDN